MTRSLVAAALVLGVAACSSDVGEQTKTDVLMSAGDQEYRTGQGLGYGNARTTETTVAMGTSTHGQRHDLSSRIFDLPADEGLGKRPFEDFSVFDVTSARTSGPTPVQEEGLLPTTQTPFEPMEDVASTETPMTAPEMPRHSRGVTGVAYQVQLGALPSEGSARREWVRIETQHPNLVVGQTPDIIAVQLTSQPGTVYRLRTSPVKEYEAAQKLCDQFKVQDQDCYVVKVKNPG